jgi:FeoC like transcriptional regulator
MTVAVRKSGVATGSLRAVLDAVRTAAPGTGLDEIARSLGLARDEVDAMVDYWERRGKLTVERLRGCSSAGCSARGPAGCSAGSDGGGFAGSDGGGCPLAGASGGDGRPVLIAISTRPGSGR